MRGGSAWSSAARAVVCTAAVGFPTLAGAGVLKIDEFQNLTGEFAVPDRTAPRFSNVDQVTDAARLDPRYTYFSPARRLSLAGRWDQNPLRATADEFWGITAWEGGGDLDVFTYSANLRTSGRVEFAYFKPPGTGRDLDLDLGAYQQVRVDLAGYDFPAGEPLTAYLLVETAGGEYALGSATAGRAGAQSLSIDLARLAPVTPGAGTQPASYLESLAPFGSLFDPAGRKGTDLAHVARLQVTIDAPYGADFILERFVADTAAVPAPEPGMVAVAAPLAVGAGLRRRRRDRNDG